MKVVLPVAGRGTRLRPHTLLHPKPLIHVAGKPIIAHITDNLPLDMADELILIVGEGGGEIADFVREYTQKKVNTVVQKEPLGLGHAIYLASSLFKGEPVLIILGDTIVEADIRQKIADNVSFLGVREVRDPERFGIVVLNEKGDIKEVEEKPKHPKSNLAIVGLYFVTDTDMLSEALRHVIESGTKTHGEYQLTDAIQRMLDEGWRPRPLTIDGWYDCGKVEALLSTNRVMLSKSKSIPRAVGECYIVPPVFLEEDAEISNSVVGPYVSVGKGVKIKNSVIRNSIVNSGALIENIVLKDSLIGFNTVIKSNFKSLNVGDHSELIER